MTDATTYAYVIRPTRIQMLSEGPTPKEAATVEAHFKYLQELHGKGVVLMAGRTLLADERVFGIVVFRAADQAAAEALAQADPAVKEGVMWAEVFPFKVALGPEGWAA